MNYDHRYWNTLPKRDAYLKAWRWSTGVDRQWKIIIGARELVVSGGVCKCINEQNNPVFFEVPGVNSSPECDQYALNHPGDVTECIWATEYETIIRESDGVATADSQRGFPGSADEFRMNFANHFQERNSEPTRLALIALFDTGVGDPWFVTHEK